ncbi:hypothetical protein CEP52_009343 [Fusarium oligoseptatum]|uniref:DUF7025 domain-containing protein n=1 Tax=Fusarium oligoseptatum TaxID=2604345 RepID=A0A428TDJ1_9HYPO|nr:hypothetical protein CEP52_009343 [Fusarium oligoseptatum]
MDENLSNSLIFNNDQSFEAYLKDFTSSPLHATQEEADTICELADYDSILNSKGRPVPVLNGCSNVFSKDFGAQGGDLGGYAIVRTTSWDANSKKTGTETVIRSFIMKAALKAIVPAYKDLNIRFSHISFSDKPRHLFHFRNALYNYAQNLEADSVAQKHVTMLFMHLNQELADAVSAYTVNVEFAQMSRFLPSIDFPHLWTIFKQGELIYVSGAVAEDGVQMLMRFRSATCNCACNSPMHRFHHSWKVEGECIDSNGKSLGRRAISVDISYFDGLRNLIQLTALPLRFHPDQNNIILQLAARGRKYVRLQGRNHRQYKGVARIFSEGQLLKPTPRSRFTLVCKLFNFYDVETLTELG